MADALMGVTETSATGLQLVSSMIQKALIEKVVLAPRCQQFIAPQGAKQIDIPRSDLPTVSTKSENTSVDAQILTYAVDQMSLDQHKAVQYLVEDIARIQSNVALIQDLIDKASRKLADDMDSVVKTQLVATSSASPDHRIAFSNASTIQAVDITNARKLLRIQNVDMNNLFLAVSPLQEKEMLDLADFIDASKYGSNEPIFNGEFGKIYGIKVLVSNNIADGNSVLFHPSHCAFAQQQAPTLETDRELANLATRISVSHIFGAKVLDSGKRAVLIGSAS